MILEDPKSHLIYSTDGHWLPPICIKQYEVFINGNRFLLISGPRLSGKTEAILHKVLKHAFDVPGSRIAIFAKALKVGKTGGVWQDLTERILPIWLKAGIGFKVTQSPKVTGDTRQNMFKVQSRFGPESEIYLHSLEFAPEVQEKLKGTKYSMIWFSEIDQIAPMSGPPPDRDDRIVFLTASTQLRMEPVVPFEAHQIIMDCNPPEDGERHWLHRIFYQEKAEENHPDKDYQNQLHRIEFSIDDNPFLDPRAKTTLYNQLRYSKSLLDRLYYGLWVEDMLGGHFHDVFVPEVHVLGNVQCVEDERQVILPTPAVTVLISGLDLGDKNNAFVIAEKIQYKDENGKVITKFALLDEIMVLDRPYEMRKFVRLMVDAVMKWSKYCNETYGRQVKWRHWSDEAAFKHFRSAAEAYDYMLVHNYSDGLIKLQPAPKYRGSIADRVKLLQQLLFDKRIHFSSQLSELITMVKVLRRGSSVADYVYPPRYTHAFDALTYMLQSEAPADEIMFSDVKVDKQPQQLILTG